MTALSEAVVTDLSRENARLEAELRTARDRQNATAEILRVIGQSPSDVQPVFDAIVVAAARLLGRDMAFVLRCDGASYWCTAMAGPEGALPILDTALVKIDPGANFPSRAIVARENLHLPDWSAIELPEYEGHIRKTYGISSALYLPLLEGGECIGVLGLAAKRAGSLGESEIALAESFRDHALIAIENVRMFNETRAALERQNASAEILRTIASAPGDADRALDQIAETSARLFGAPSATIHIAEGDGWARTIRFGASSKRVGAGVPDSMLKIGGRNMPGTIVAENRQVHVPDLGNVDPAIADWPGLPYVREAGTRSMSGSPLRREGKAIGALIVYRDRLAPFTPEELAVQQTFADQAAIAIENARLFNETREALERQTATADILKVIASSPEDVQPVFEAIAASANQLLGGFSTAVFRFIDETAHLAAFTPTTPAADEVLKSSFPSPLDGFEGFKLAQGGEPVQIPNAAALPDSRIKQIAQARGFRSMLFSPLMSGGNCIGLISVTRLEPGSFSPNHLQLLQTFADQAVIAIENVRLFNETKEALERQTATADILKVIASSPDDVQPVFDAIATSSKQLLGGFSATVFRFIDDMVNLVAYTPVSPAADKVLLASFPRPTANLSYFEFAKRGDVVQEADSEANPDAGLREVARARGFRSSLFAPLMSKGAPIGLIVVTRKDPGTFADHHVQLLQTFADQAVIAIENVRLFDEVQARTRDLTESLQQQTATADVLKVISRSAFDLQTVFETLVESAAGLCRADKAAILRLKDGRFQLAATHGFPPQFRDLMLARGLDVDRGSVVGRAALERRTVQVDDILADPEFAVLESQKQGGFRTVLGVPLLREGNPIGALFLTRGVVEPFTPQQIDLVTTFADQAVIAIENVRLFDEVQARTRDLTEALTYQTGSANILRVIASSPTDVDPVLEAIVTSACELCDATDAVVFLHEGDDLVSSAHHGPIPEAVIRLPISRTRMVGRAFLDRVAVHVRDFFGVEGDEFPDGQALARRMGHRTMLAVPLLREGNSVGVIALRRNEVLPFNDKQITLLQTFADQAVIAIGNVRLFQEVQARTEDLRESLQQQTATAEVLKVISRSAFDLQTVLDTLVNSASTLCNADQGMLLLVEGGILKPLSYFGPHPDKFEFRKSLAAAPHRGNLSGRAVLDGQTAHAADVLIDPEFTNNPWQQLTGFRGMLAVPLMRQGQPIGAMALSRTTPGLFAERQIDLVTTFADQAVIAIENVRLFDEVQARTRDLSEALQQQTATADVLKVISRSAFDLQTVLDTLVESAARLCDADRACVFKKSGELFHWVSNYGFSDELIAYANTHPFAAGPGSTTSRVALEGKSIHNPDVLADPNYKASEYQRLGNYRTMLGIPLLREGAPIGVFILAREQVRPFTDRQIELVTSFADQAVIAIENVRLFDEVQARTRELAASLDDLRTAQDRLVQTEKLASLGQLTAGIAHEIKNPLNFVNNFAALSAELTDELNDVLRPVTLADKIREEIDELTQLLKDNLEKVVQHGKRADSIVKNMLLHSREGSGDHRPADINALLDESLNLAYHGARAEKPEFNVTLQRDFDEAAGTIELFPQEITRVFLNLISNGFYAVTKRKTENGSPGFEPMLSATTKNLGDTVEIRIRDNGTGIPAEVREKMFNPFFTTKPAGEGTGLGLSMSHDIIVKQHGGTIDVATEAGQFTEFTVVLPRTSHLQNRKRGQS